MSSTRMDQPMVSSKRQLPSRFGTSLVPSGNKLVSSTRHPSSYWKSVIRAIIPIMSLREKVANGTSDRIRKKSFANVENIENFDKNENNLRLEEKMKLWHLEQLLIQFQNHKPADIITREASGYFPSKVQKRHAGCMNLQEFKLAITKVLGTNEYDGYLEKLFTKLDTSCDGYVDWNEFCTYLLLLYRENDYIGTKKEIPFLAEPKIRHIVHNRQEPTTKIMAVDGPTRYITISKEGSLSVWNASLMFEKSYNIGSDPNDLSGAKRRFKMWVTDAVYMPNCHKIAVSSTSRDLRFYDASTNHYFEEFHLFAMSDVPYCFDYSYDVKNPNSESLLVCGLDSGAVNLFYFHKPVTQLFETPFKNESGAQKIFMQDIAYHSKWVKYICLPGIHPEMIRQVMYLPDNVAVISASGNSRNSLVISDVHRLKQAYIFRLKKGVECFDYNKALNILVTGSADHHLRIWNPYVTSKPVALLRGHSTGIIGTVIHEGLSQIFSYSRDAVIKVWDIKEHACVQTMMLKFPSSIHGRMPEHGQFPIFLQPDPFNSLMVTCNDYVGLLMLGHLSCTKDDAPTTHDTQLCSAIYNQFFKQVVTGCDSSAIAVWDIETGSKAIVFSNAHAAEEITCMVFDESWRRLITGARNGTIKVWNFQNGHNLHKLEPVTEAEVTGILPLTDKKVILSVGWSRMITLYDDSDPTNMYVIANLNWKGGQVHQDDILAMDNCPPNLLVTASFDGSIVVWNLETEKILLHLRHQPPSQSKTALHFSHTLGNNNVESNSRPNSRHCTSHRVPKGQPDPVDKLLFLRARATSRLHSDAAILISSEAGTLHWWSIFGPQMELGSFYVPDVSDESVLALCTKPDNALLMTGDTQGNIKVWNIEDYCLQPENLQMTSKPEVAATWRAHDGAVVSLEFVEHEDGTFLLSASSDKTAKLWTVEGCYIGTFGQQQSWDLKVKGTWGCSKIVKDPVKATPQISKQVDNGETDVDKQNKDKIEPQDPERENACKDHVKEEFSPSSSDLEESDVAAVDEQHLMLTKQDKSLPLKMQYRSATFTYGNRDDFKTFLGPKFEREMVRKALDRQGRRETFGDINTQHMSRFGKICSPYQVLTMHKVQEIQMPKNLPLRDTWLSRIYTSVSIKEENEGIPVPTAFPTDGKNAEPTPKIQNRLPALKSYRMTGHHNILKKHPTVI